MRVLATLAIMAVVCVASITTVTAQQTQRYIDVPPGKSYSDAVEWSAAEDIMAGCSRTRFCPTKYATRWMVVEALHNHHQVLIRDVRDAVAEAIPVSIPHEHPVVDCIADGVERASYGDTDDVVTVVHNCVRILSDKLHGW